MVAHVPPDAKAALDTFLAEWDGVSFPISTLEAGLRDARVTMAEGKALWLATLGYLVTLELLGAGVARRRTKFPDRAGSEKRFTAGAREFAAGRISPPTASALYSLRCSLAHEFGLRNQPRHVFLLAQDGPLAKHPRRPWDGTPSGAVKRSVQTRVNVRAVGALVEGVVEQARALHKVGQVELAPGRAAADLLAFGRFYIS
jgi:hypothetical protein